MDVRKLMLMAGALMFAVVCALAARNMFGGNGTPAAAALAPVPSGPEVLVATRALPVGTIVGADAFRYQPWPKDLVGQAYFIRGDQPGAQALIGTVVRYAIPAGQPITQGALIKPSDRGFLAAALAPGMRAVSIALSAQQGVSGFVFPGDRVDLILTQTVPGGGDGVPLKASETIIRNLRVLATDQRTDKTADATGKTQVVAYSNVTLEATPRLAEKIAVAQTVGTLSLSLRSIADDRMELEREIAAGERDAPADAKAEQAMLLEIASHPQDTDTTATTGGDVSRYQPHLVPPKAAAAGGPVMASAAPAMPAAAPAPGGMLRRGGPIVIIARGNTLSEVPLGSN
jgi:pilus assembly protein CpaB